MKYVVSYSGGVGSAITAEMVCSTYGEENVILLFADTLIEDIDLYRFNSDIVNLLNCEFIRIADGRTPWEVFEDVKFIGNSRIDPCSKHLKRDLLKRWIRNHFKPDEVEIFVGIDCSEEHRLPRVVQNNVPYKYRSILIEENVFLDQEQKKQWCRDRYIKMPRLYELGFSHNNCGGFCVKSGQAQFKNLYKYLPEVYMQNEKEEQRLMANNPNLKPFIKKQIKGVKYYFTMREFREKFLETNQEIDEHDWGGCGCAL